VSDPGGASNGDSDVGIAAWVRQLVPITVWLPAYARADLRPDLVAGVTSWGVMVPVALAYASLAGLPPEYGLITAFAALTGYALLATSRHLKVTTSSTMAVMSLAVVAPLAAGDPTRFAALSAALALVAGGLLIAGGLLRLGFISEFMAKPVVTGFVFGVAVTIIVGQLPELLGVEGGSGNVFEQLRQLVPQLPETNPWSLAIGAAALVLILVLRRLVPAIPGALVAMVLGIVVVSAFALAQYGVAIVGEVSTVRPSIGLPAVGIGDLAYLLAGAGGVVFLAVGESLGSARSFAMAHHYEIDGDQELVAIGGANVASGLFGGFIVDASLSQSAAAEASGGRTQVSSLVTAGLVLATALLLAPLFRNLPMSVLAAVVISSVIGLIDPGEIARYWSWQRADGVLAVVALVGVISTDVLTGLILAVLISLSLLLFRASRPYLAVLGRLPGEQPVYVDIARHDNAETVPGLLILRIDAPLYFFNATVARSQVLERVDQANPRPATVVMDVGASTDLDVTTAEMLGQLAVDLGDRGATLALGQARGRVRDRLERTGLLALIGEDRVHLSMLEAVETEGSRLADAHAAGAEADVAGAEPEAAGAEPLPGPDAVCSPD
jgi:high affinity sulfate transporter 1